MEIRQANPAWRWLFLIVILLAAAALALLGGKNALAEHWAQSAQPEDLLRAARWEPGNADYWYRLGHYRQFDFEHADLPLAIVYYRRALAIDPRSARYWMDLASAYEMQDDFVQARQAFESAQLAYPLSSSVAWRYGNFLLRREQVPEALAEIRRAVTLDLNLATPAISLCWRSLHDIDRILDQALPPQSYVYQSAINLLVAEHEASAALIVWNRLLALKPALELGSALALVDQLIEQGRAADGKLVWRQLTQAARWAKPESFGKSLVWDGGFEGEFANGGFGWRQMPVGGASFGFDAKTFHSGARALRISFDRTTNVDFRHLTQYVAAEPSTRYRFTAWVQTEQITTNSGVRFEIRDPQPGSELSAMTPNLVGTLPWFPVVAEFTAGPQTHLLQITLRRLPSQKLDNKIAGVVWVDDVSLVPIDASQEQRTP